MKPLLAAQLDFTKLVYPVFVSPKIDGIRALTYKGALWSRSLKMLPNRYIQSKARGFIDGLDGEIVVGPPTHPNCMQNTSSGVMSYAGEPKFKYLVFDSYWAAGGYSYRHSALKDLLERNHDPYVELVQQHLCHNAAEVKWWMDEFVKLGYEGLMARHHNSPYKQGRSTVREGSLLKYKIYESEWAKIVGFEEFMHNGNELKTDNLGYAERSSHKENMVPMNMLGALVVKSPKWANTFKVGSGFDFTQRREIWKDRDLFMGRTVEFLYQPHGVLDVPRMPVFKAFREDM